MFYSEISEIFKNTFFHGTLPVAASHLPKPQVSLGPKFISNLIIKYNRMTQNFA